MNLRQYTDRIALVCDYLPRNAASRRFSRCPRVDQRGSFRASTALSSRLTIGRRYAYPPEVRFEFRRAEITSYRRAADFINFSDAEVVVLQHEFGIFGVRRAEISSRCCASSESRSLLTAHHLGNPEPSFRHVMDEIVQRSARLVVMTRVARRILAEVHGAAPERIDVIPHGIPDMPLSTRILQRSIRGRGPQGLAPPRLLSRTKEVST